VTTSLTQLRIDRERLLSRLDALGEIGAIDGGGVCRLALTQIDGEGRDLVVSWMHDLGLRVEVDGVGNVVGTWPADRFDAPVMTGSHIDTVATGGRFDGNLGVLAGLEVLETVIRAGVETARPLAVAFFTNEEGARFAPDMLGSLVFAGGLPLEVALDTVAIDGAVLAEELDRVGYVGTLPCPARPPRAFVELHIEQGPILEAEGVTIGVVTGVQGISWHELVFSGQSNHAGTTPIDMRHDAALVAALTVVAVRRLTETTPGLVGTVGRIDLHPDLVNVVAARASITVDLRHADDDVLTEAERTILEQVGEMAAAEGVTFESSRLARFEPVTFDPAVVGLVEQVAVEHGHTARRLASGAGHDAQILARVCPAAMIFTPSVRGISHNPAEYTEPEDLEAGANVLLDVMLRLAGAGGDQSRGGDGS
jgi:beta-ureidopropionase / N-carbamoyl-L-amino-acid hydrolase